jgi:hypothetical protein
MDFSTDKMWCTLKSNEQTNQLVVRVSGTGEVVSKFVIEELYREQVGGQYDD